jgi:hypothetical protein
MLAMTRIIARAHEANAVWMSCRRIVGYCIGAWASLHKRTSQDATGLQMIDGARGSGYCEKRAGH